LVATLRARKIAGAGLDVYDIEPLPLDHPFRSLENAITTPHLGFVTNGTYKTFYGDTVENILAWMKGQPIRVMEP
jgi:phosphoglycerate dehydrogenase-like enzyme